MKARTLRLLLLLFPHFLCQRTINVGMMIAENSMPDDIGWAKNGGAVGIAMDKLKREGLMTQYTFSFQLNTSECDEAMSAGIAVKFMQNKVVDLIIGPPCLSATISAGILSTFYGVPLVVWAFNTAAEIANVDRFSQLASIMPNSRSLAYSVLATLAHFQWTEIGILYTSNQLDYCDQMIADFDAVISDDTSYKSQIRIKTKLKTNDDIMYMSQLEKTKDRARVFLVCLDTSSSRRQFFSRIHEAGMTGPEFVFILMAMRGLIYGQSELGKTKLANGLTPLWEDTRNGELDSAAREGAMNTLVIDISDKIANRSELEEFQKNVGDSNSEQTMSIIVQLLPRIREHPFYCQSIDCVNNQNNSALGSYSRHLHDAVYLAGRAVEKTLLVTGGQWDAQTFMQNCVGRFSGLTGDVSINANMTRDPFFFLYRLARNETVLIAANISSADASGLAMVFTPTYESDAELWINYGGIQPLSTPLCGFKGDTCPKDFWSLYLVYIIVAVVFLFVVIIFSVCFVLIVIRNKKLEEKRLNGEWQIPYVALQQPPSKKDERSMHSIQSGTHSVSTRMTVESKIFSNEQSLYYLYNEPVIASKHVVAPLDAHDYHVFRKMRKLHHDNLNKFIGVSIDGPEYMAVWKLCSRGSLEHLITKGSLTVDTFFIYCIVMDIANGLSYLHDSFIKCHGNLRSAVCLVDESWQVKIGDYGLSTVKQAEKSNKHKLLWTAPEILRCNGGESKEADVYSFAIICSELVTRKSPWNMDNRSESVEELTYLIKKGGVNPPRPDVTISDIEVNPSMILLIRDCWSENPSDRPTMNVVKNLIVSMNPSRQKNLMDHVFNMMEEYAGSLEEEVEERMKELVEEKKKSDVLLYRMLPQQVADKLKLGQSVEPESFQSVTIFFSDVVQFTKLAAKSSPFQIVTLLNDLYTMFDTIIEENGVYKVETIGDGYLCVSGLPKRNGDEHVKDIAQMSIGMMKTVKTFRIAHLPNEKTNIRIGFHTGPCVSGVVGLTMPRYCLFGDSVNTASRMESNGKPAMIHMSGEANKLLTQVGGYVTESRGEVIIKGKGVMETFWLRGRVDEAPPTDGSFPPSPPPPPAPHAPPPQSPPTRFTPPMTDYRVTYTTQATTRTQDIL